MIRFRHTALSLGLLGAFAVPAAAAGSLQNAHPIIEVKPSASGRVLVQWEPGEIRCNGTPITGQPIRRPWNQLGWVGNQAPRALTIRFAIDSTGRPVSLTRETAAFVPLSEDVEPALAASRFAARKPQQGCTVTYTMRSSPLAEAEVPELMSYTVHPLSGRLPEEGWQRIRSAGGTCLSEPQPQPLERHFPDFTTIPATPGVRDWSMIRYDIDEGGRPRGAAVLIGTDNRALDAAGVKAIRESRFTKGARTGCLYPYWRAAAKLPAPDMPESIRTTKVEGNCPDQHGWAVPPQLRFPEPYRRRSIEGWAVISYDVAPWGQTGNLKVIAAQPSDEFGIQALAMLRAARLPTSQQGYTGCVDRVRFNMGPDVSPSVGGEGGAPVPAA
ncbi:energy transducer TonB [Sphingomonas fuzhouensis]|uniref:energy transducer TonB n=1 Tax=Sphingomonas fuzhouensis TaxID=3106033 RepID=UPI002AFFC2D7|nr:energy transducer TonB [Sphingomonas sp. SGZ-02]